MPKVIGLRCRECGAEYELQATHVCEMCFGPLDAVYDEALLRKIVKRDRIESGPKSMWRYRDLLPVEDSVAVVTLGEGLTPLVKADRLGAELGLRNLYLKNDSMNPTNSFKDRVVSIAISWARAHGFETIAGTSTVHRAHPVAACAETACLRSQALRRWAARRSTTHFIPILRTASCPSSRTRSRGRSRSATRRTVFT